MMYRTIALLATFSIPVLSQEEGRCCGGDVQYTASECTLCPALWYSRDVQCREVSHERVQTRCGLFNNGCQISCVDKCPQRDYGCGCGVDCPVGETVAQTEVSRCSAVCLGGAGNVKAHKCASSECHRCATNKFNLNCGGKPAAFSDAPCATDCIGGAGNVKRTKCQACGCAGCATNKFNRNCGGTVPATCPDAVCPADCLGGAGYVLRGKCAACECAGCATNKFNRNCGGYVPSTCTELAIKDWKRRYYESIDTLWAVSGKCQRKCIENLGLDPQDGWKDARLDEACIDDQFWYQLNRKDGLNSPVMPIGQCSLKCAIGEELGEIFIRYEWRTTCKPWHRDYTEDEPERTPGPTLPANEDKGDQGVTDSLKELEDAAASNLEVECNAITTMAECGERDDCHPFPIDSERRKMTCHSLTNAAALKDRLKINKNTAAADAKMCDMFMTAEECDSSGKCFMKNNGKCVSTIKEAIEKVKKANRNSGGR